MGNLDVKGLVGDTSEPDPEREEDEEEALEGLISGLAGDNDAKVLVYRYDEKRKQRHVQTVHPSDFNLDDLHNLFPNGGDFRLIFQRANHKYHGSRTVFLDKKPGYSQNAENKGSTDELSIREQMRLMEDRNFRLLELMMKNNQPQSSKLDLAGIAAIVTAGGTVLASLKDMFSKSNGDTSTFLELVKVADQFRSGGKETSILDVMKEMIPTLGNVAKFHSTESQKKLEHQPSDGDQPSEDPQQQREKMFAQHLRQKIAPLIEAAQNNEDPDLYVDIVCLKLGPENVKKWISEEPDILSKLIQIEPKINDYRGWFAELIAGIKEYLSDEDQEESPHGEGETQ